MASRSSAYFHLLRSCFLVPAAAFVACTCRPLPSPPSAQEDKKGRTQQALETEQGYVPAYEEQALEMEFESGIKEERTKG